MTEPRTETFVLVQEMGEAHDQLDALLAKWHDVPRDDEHLTDEDYALVEEIRRLTKVIEDEAIRGKFRKLGFMKWEALKGKYPPKEGDKPDLGWASFSSEFWPGAIRTCMAEPELSDDEWAAVWERTSHADRERLITQVLELNQGGLSIPKPLRPLPETTRSGSGSKRRRASA